MLTILPVGVRDENEKVICKGAAPVPAPGPVPSKALYVLRAGESTGPGCPAESGPAFLSGEPGHQHPAFFLSPHAWLSDHSLQYRCAVLGVEPGG